jgi:hypothetical protein
MRMHGGLPTRGLGNYSELGDGLMAVDAELVQKVHERLRWDDDFTCPEVVQGYDESLCEVLARGLTLLEGVPNLILCPWSMAEELMRLNYAKIRRGGEGLLVDVSEDDVTLFGVGFIGRYEGIPVIASGHLVFCDPPFAILSQEADPLKVSSEGPGTVLVKLKGSPR